VDLPGGGGKVTLSPRYEAGREGAVQHFRNWRGDRYAYPDAADGDLSCPYEAVFYGR